MPYELLISGIGKRNALLRIFKEACASHDISLIGDDAQHSPPARVEVEEFYQLPLCLDDAFAGSYEDLVLQQSIDFSISLIDPEISIITRMAEDGKLGKCQTLHPSFSSTTLCEDKFEFAHKLEKSGVGYIPTFKSPIIDSKYIIKDRFGSAASGFQIVEPNGDPSIKADQTAIYQPFVPSPHYCVDAYFDLNSGNLSDLCVKEVLSKTRGESYLVESIDPKPFVEICQSIGRAIPLKGIVNFDIYNYKGELVCMEVNCRPGGNYPASHAFGVDLISKLLADVFTTTAFNNIYTEYHVGLQVGKYFEFTQPFYFE